ncbi:hypothetical protein H4W00_001893 [Psychrobacter sp. PL19]|uniref:hypothetical protein n=1 Tax=Psychrobacter sp. PL19 TaxID=2760711 RepID=UPI001AEB40DA
MRSYVELYPQSLDVNSEGQRRACLIKENAATGESTEKELWFIYPTDLPMPEDDNCDAYLIAVLHSAMIMGTDIRVYGSVSRELLSNLTEFQYVWEKWYPELYSLVEIKVEHIRENEIPVNGAVSAFSGGADAQFTSYRHAKGKAGYRTQSLRAGVFVHGFDIPLDDIEGFFGAAKKAAESLDDLDLALLIVKTNIRNIFPINWEHHCGAALVSVLCGLNSYAGIGLIGSSDTYERLPPWGSHPMTDPLLSSGSFRIIHDGSGFNRTDKLKVIAEWSLGIQNLRVCWEGDQSDRNCGSCEKCVRTRMNFLAAGSVNPSCFNTPLCKGHLRAIIPSQGVRVEWVKISKEIIKTGNGVEWLPEVKKLLNRKTKSKLGFLFPFGT